MWSQRIMPYEKAFFAIGAMIGLLIFGSAAHGDWAAPPLNECLTMKLRAEGKAAAGYLGCYVVGTHTGVTASEACLTKKYNKFKRVFEKQESEGSCPPPTPDFAARNDDTAAFAATIVLTTTLDRCGAAHLKGIARLANLWMRCVSKLTSGTLLPENIESCFGREGGAVWSKYYTYRGACRCEPEIRPLFDRTIATEEFVRTQACLLAGRPPLECEP